MENINFDSLKRRRDLRIILPVFLVSIIACIDRVNISYAKLTMTQTLSWLSPEVYGFGAGIFFAGYLLLEIPGSLFAAKFSASKWISRIMFTWGIVSLCMAFVTTEWQFYLCRFLLGASEASLYPVIYSLLFPRWFTAAERARATSLMLTSLLLSTIIGAPIAGVLLEHSFFGLLGWQELFILESIPALCFAFYFFFAVKDRPDQASWLKYGTSSVPWPSALSASAYRLSLITWASPCSSSVCRQSASTLPWAYGGPSRRRSFPARPLPAPSPSSTPAATWAACSVRT